MVDPRRGHNSTGWWAVNLWHTALSAAEETLGGGPLASAWLRLFRTHLSLSELDLLRWRGDLGRSAEMRRVYSRLYGRYFARALLASRLGITDFVSLNRNSTQIPDGVSVERIDTGDIPDWIAWDPQENTYVLGEAKGCLTGSAQQFLGRTPSCVDAGKVQFTRVIVRDLVHRQIATHNWVAANLWSTDARKREPISLLWDPPGDGVALTDEEVPRHANAIRKHRIATITRQLGDPAIAVRIAIKPSDDNVPSGLVDADRDSRYGRTEQPSREPHEDDYLAAIITPLGIQPIRDAADLRTAHAIKKRADSTGEPAMIYGLARRTPQTAESHDMPWLSDNGIVAPDGSSLFNLTNVEIGLS